ESVREGAGLRDGTVDEIFIADAVGVEETGNAGGGGHRVRHAATGEDLLAGPGQVGRDHRAGEGELFEGRGKVHRRQGSQVAAVEDAVARADVPIRHAQGIAVEEVSIADRPPDVRQL